MRCPGTSGEVSGARTTRALRASPPPRSKSAVAPHLARALHSALHLLTKRSGRRGRLGPPGHLRPGRAQRPARPLARRPRSLRPFPHARCPASDSAGHRRARPVAARARWGRRHSQATRPRRSPARPSTCMSASRAVRPPSPRVPRTAEVGIGTTQREIGPRPSCRPRRAWPRGGRVSSRLCPAHDKVKLSRWRSFLAVAARSPPPAQAV